MDSLVVRVTFSSFAGFTLGNLWDKQALFSHFLLIWGNIRAVL